MTLVKQSIHFIVPCHVNWIFENFPFLWRLTSTEIAYPTVRAGNLYYIIVFHNSFEIRYKKFGSFRPLMQHPDFLISTTEQITWNSGFIRLFLNRFFSCWKTCCKLKIVNYAKPIVRELLLLRSNGFITSKLFFFHSLV